MKISTKGRYALRLMLDLAMYSNGEPVSLKDISERQSISEKYLEQIISILNRGGLVRSIRGSKGGYLLNKEPVNITVGMILRATEGDLSPVNCVSFMDTDDVCDRRDQCVTYRVYERLNKAINDVVDDITLADMMGWQNENADMYSI